MAKHDQLAKILGLLGSAHDGEVLAAARQAQAYLAQRKLRWGDVLGSGADSGRRAVERRLLALREAAHAKEAPFDKDELAEVKALIREFTGTDTIEPGTLRRIEWLEAVVEHAADRAAPPT
jgi:hypothetical protein